MYHFSESPDQVKQVILGKKNMVTAKIAETVVVLVVGGRN
jgi:hypothetical protein|tara:strand:- start:636 stop:755 length:120 start_codon:yes stop_codon:yes gene_type:complete